MIDIVRAAIVPELNTFCAVPIIEADQTGDKPSGQHATFKFTSTRIKDVGQAEEKPVETNTTYKLQRIEQYKIVMSITAFDDSADDSEQLANKIYDWFDFYGVDILAQNNIVVVSKTGIQNRDVFIADYYERRNGFDVTVRVTKVIERDINSIGEVETTETIN